MSDISHLGLDYTFSQYWGKELQGSLTAIAIIFSFLTNGLIVLLWCQFRGLRTAANCLVLNLAIKGLLDAVVNGLVLFQFLIPNCRVLKHDYPLLNSFQIVECFFYFLNVLSILILMLSRYCAVAHKLRYHVWNTKRKSLIAIITVWIVSGILDALFQISLLSTRKKDKAKPETFLEFKRNSFKQAKVFWLVSLGVPMGVIAIFASMICIYLHLGLHNTRKLSYSVSDTKVMRVKDAVTNASVLSLATLENIVTSNERSLPEKNLNLEMQTQVYSIPTPFSQITKKQVGIGKVKNVKSPMMECHTANSNINILHQFEFYLLHSKMKRKNLKESPTVFAFQKSGSTIEHCGLENNSVLSSSSGKSFCLITKQDRSKSESDLLSIDVKASFSGFLDLNCSEEQLIFPEGIDISMRSHLGLALRYSSTKRCDETCLEKRCATRKRSMSEPPDKTRNLCNENQILSFIDLNKDTLNRKESKKNNKETKNMKKENASIFDQTEFPSTPQHQQDHEIGAYYNKGVSFEEEAKNITPVFPSNGSEKELARQVPNCSTGKGFNPGIMNKSPSTTPSKTFTLFSKINRRHNSQAEANLVKSKISVLLCAGAHIACYIPFLVEIILIDSNYDIAAGSKGLWLHFFSLYFILLNNICNPVLYCLKCDNFYQASISLMKSLKNKFKRNQPLYT